MEDSVLVEYVKKGNNLAFTQLVEKYQNSLYCTALTLTGSVWDSLDILQDTFLKAFTKIDSLREGSRFKYWITQILVNSCYDTHRKRKRVTPVDYIEEAVYSFKNAEAHLDLLNAISKLEEKHRTVLSLRYFQDLPLKDIAAILGCPEGTVKSRLNHSLSELKTHLKYKSYGEAIE